MADKNTLEAHSMATVLDLAYTQYSLQWQKLETCKLVLEKCLRFCH